MSLFGNQPQGLRLEAWQIVRLSWLYSPLARAHAQADSPSDQMLKRAQAVAWPHGIASIEGAIK
jgi:hypothetical protein